VSALFTPRANLLARVATAIALAALVAVPVLAMVWVRTPTARGEHRVIAQPVAFDHRVHAAGLQIRCEFCHSGADRSARAGVPPTLQCIGCHTDTWLASTTFAPIRASVQSGEPVAWKRVTQLPAFVYFNHAIHVTNKVGCAQCHGDVGSMGVVRQERPLTMEWCLECHRRVAAARPSRSLTNCTTCHR
jgi:hypothetical protein